MCVAEGVELRAWCLELPEAIVGLAGLVAGASWAARFFWRASGRWWVSARVCKYRISGGLRFGVALAVVPHEGL